MINNHLSLSPINLRSLQSIRIIHVYRFPLTVKINGADSAFAMAVACGFYPAERQMNFGADRGSVDVGDPGVKIAHGGEGLVHVFGVDRRRESVLNIVGDADGVLETFAGNDGNHRAENLLLRDAHLRINIDEYRWLDEPSVLEVALSQAIAAAFNFCAFGASDFDVVEIAIHLGLVDGRTHLAGLVQAVADFQLFGAFDVAVDEFGYKRPFAR